MLINIVNQSLGVLAHTEEISLLLGRLHRAAAVRALAVNQLRLCKKGFAGSDGYSLIISLVDISLIVELFENFLYLLLMVSICGADELVVGSIHQIPDGLDLSRHLIYKFLRGNAGLRCL